MRMDEGTIYAGTIARTFDILYPDAGAFKYDRDLEKEKIKNMSNACPMHLLLSRIRMYYI